MSTAIRSSNCRLESPADPPQQLAAVRRQIAPDAAESDRAAQQSRAEEPILCPHETFAQRLGAARRDGEGDVGRQRADVGDVVVDALELQQDHPQGAGPRAAPRRRQTLDRVRVRQRVPDGGVAGDRFREEQSVPPRQAFEALLDALVDVEEPELQVQHRLARDAEPEMARLDHAGVHGSHRHLEHALAGDGPERVTLAGARGTGAVGREVLSERPRAVGPVVVERDARRVGVAVGRQAEEVHDLPFEPVRRRVLRAIEGKTAQRDRLAPTPQERLRRGSDQTWCRQNAPVRSRVVGREQRHQPRVEALADRVGQRGKRVRHRVHASSSGRRSRTAPAAPERGRTAAASRRHDAPQTTRVAA